MANALRALQAWIDSSPDNEHADRLKVGHTIRQHVADPHSTSLLIMFRDKVSSLPVLPPAEDLMVMYCPRLTEFPDVSQCSQLATMTVAHCPLLTTLPAIGHLQQLRTLNLTALPLVSLPPDLLQLHRDCHVTLEVSGLSEAAMNLLTDAIHHPRYQGPQVHYAMPVSLGMRAELIDAVTGWHAEAITENSARLNPSVWKRLPGHDNAASFATFLTRIRATQDYLGGDIARKAAMQDRVVKLLEQLQYDSALRNDCFNLAEDAITSCGDRIAMGLLDMEMRCLISRKAEEIRAGYHDASPQNLVDLCKGQYRLKILERLTREKSATEPSIDEVEFYLGQLLTFSERYALPVKITSMAFPAVSPITPEDRARAESELANQGLSEPAVDKNNQAYLAFMASSPLMHGLLERVCETDMSAAKNECAQRMAQEKSGMYAQLEALQGEAASTGSLVRESDRLMRAFHSLETDLRVQTTLPVLLGLLAQHGISPTL
ncbi:NEL-type E3 ubiquitin ligase domain-containing protein [Actimicrobium sp. CCI2.3]|uniref:NEL-type E3 ubiquitin ligase domain-containing protein n=1 Tax=Actimicrobium sp. CCI2.3 TaxID=3048616 RepID=UPI002AB57528|nr:NEL-type E3 ubiquitin ligase domain-containing protein [Actimicrobium sp. CCI2.3]MDY7573915.1 NEL-type E3 ubiquitin ligase domain-containing protein [Actimicrobium sp. CCI2.3]MEB0023047.1 NEL-type E3 ubiquitin ligase domain-containing protein [Actimicrobium sp. CCI2.3]